MSLISEKILIFILSRFYNKNFRYILNIKKLIFNILEYFIAVMKKS